MRSDIRYVISEGASLYRQPGDDGFAKLVRGQALRWTGEREDDWVRVQPVDAQGEPSGNPGWISGSDIGTGSRGVLNAEWVSFRGQQYAAGPAGRHLLSGNFPASARRRSWCAGVGQQCMPELPRGIGSARNYLTRLRELGWYQLQPGDEPQVDDCVIYDRYGRPGTMGYKHGHFAFVVIGGRDGITPMGASWMTIDGVPQIDVRDIGRGAVIFRPPSRARTRAGVRPQVSDSAAARRAIERVRPGATGSRTVREEPRAAAPSLLPSWIAEPLEMARRLRDQRMP